MLLTDALDKFRGLELKMSSVYLWCSIDAEELELRQFFTDMSDQELGHARYLDEIARAVTNPSLEIDVPASLANDEERKIDAMIAFVKTGPGLDATFAKITEMESGEINLVFESICHSDAVARKYSGATCINTKFHINLLKKAAETFPLSDGTRAKISAIQVRDRDYFRVFSE
jgi:hypothetical protein